MTDSSGLAPRQGGYLDTRTAAGNSLADVLERVLDKGIVIVGDIQIRLLDIELLTIKIRLMIASVERAQEMGIDWWQSDPFVSSLANGNGSKREELEPGKRGQVQ